MARRTYTPAEKDAALELYRTDGPAAAAAATGIPKHTIASWARRAGVHTECIEATSARIVAARLTWEERRVDLAHGIGELAQAALGKALEETQAGSGRNAKDHATTMAIAVDKAQLLAGAATSRHEQVDSRRRVEALRDELAERRQRTA